MKIIALGPCSGIKLEANCARRLLCLPLKLVLSHLYLPHHLQESFIR